MSELERALAVVDGLGLQGWQLRKVKDLLATVHEDGMQTGYDMGREDTEGPKAGSCLTAADFHCRGVDHCNCKDCHPADKFPGFRDLSGG